MENNIFRIIDVSSLQGDMALESVNYGIVECMCDEFHICQVCLEEDNDDIDESIKDFKEQ